jgi:hypothetical protein
MYKGQKRGTVAAVTNEQMIENRKSLVRKKE